MEIGVLGPVQVVAGGRPINLGTRRERFLLGVFALAANRVMTVDRLVALCWPAEPPPSARRTLQSQISRLRGTLSRVAPDDQALRLRGVDGGYGIYGDADSIDAHQFTTLLAAARKAVHDHVRLEILEQALSLWRGPALTNAAPEPIRTQLSGHLDLARLDAVEDRLEAWLRQGRLQEVVFEAAQFTHGCPYWRPRIITAHMLGLYLSGRSGEALTVYQHVQHHLAEDFGLDPPKELRDLQMAILRGDNPAIPQMSPPATVSARGARRYARHVRS